MALIQSPWALGNSPVARPQTAHATHSQLFIVNVPAAGFQVGDILELGVLPPYATIVDAAIVPIGSLGAAIVPIGSLGAAIVPIGSLGAATVDIGVMSGEVGELLNTDGSARTSGNQLFAGATITGLTRLTKTDMLVAATSDKPRSIGVTFAGAAVTAGAGKRFGLLLHFVQ